jgi:hypothetical protein
MGTNGGTGGDEARRGGDRRDHLLHQHVQPVGDAGAGLVARKPWNAACSQAIRQDQPGARLAGGHRVSAASRSAGAAGRAGLSTWWATAARPALATLARCPARWSKRSPALIWWLPPCFQATAILKAGSTRMRANYLASPPLVVAYALAGTVDIDLVQRADRPAGTESRFICRISGLPGRRSSRRRSSAVKPEMFVEKYADVFTGNPDLECHPGQPGDSMPGIPSPPISRNLPSSPT